MVISTPSAKLRVNSGEIFLRCLAFARDDGLAREQCFARVIKCDRLSVTATVGKMKGKPNVP